MNRILSHLSFFMIGIIICSIFFIPHAFSVDASYYNTATNNPGLWRVSKVEYDHDNDGVIDDVENNIYNVDGNYLKREFAGVLHNNTIFYYTYDENGKKIKREMDRGRDGIINQILHYTYDVYGNMVMSYDDNFITYYTCDVHGNYSQKKTYGYSNGIQGEQYYQIDYYYDINNYTNDSSNQPIIIADSIQGRGVKYLTYNADGMLMEIVYDDGFFHLYNYDSEGNWIEYWGGESEINLSGFVLYYDDSPQQILDKSFEFDPWDKWENFSVAPAYWNNYRMNSKAESYQNGLITEVANFRFDLYGLLNRIETDENNDGTIDSVHYYTWIKDGTASDQSVPKKPTLSLNVSGTTVSLSWSADNADSYKLYAAPYPDASVIYGFDMGSQTSISFDLPADSAFYVAVRASNSSGMSDWSNFEYFDLASSNNDAPGKCGAYVAPGVWKEFDCYNLAAIGKTTNDDPFTPSWRLNGGYWQWGRKGPDPNQWYDTNMEHFAHGPTGPDYDDANSKKIYEWDASDAPDGAWSDASKTSNDPCPAGYRVPISKQWKGVVDNNTQSKVGTWSSYPGDPVNYNAARFFGNDLMLPAAGHRSYYSVGALSTRGNNGFYWSSSELSSGNAWLLDFNSGGAATGNYFRRSGFSVRCVAE